MTFPRIWIFLEPHVVCTCTPYIWPLPPKFELTNQHSAGGRNYCLDVRFMLTKGIEAESLFFLETAVSIHEKGFKIPENT